MRSCFPRSRQAFCVFNVAETVDSLGGTGIDVESMALGTKMIFPIQNCSSIPHGAHTHIYYIYNVDGHQLEAPNERQDQ